MRQLTESSDYKKLEEVANIIGFISSQDFNSYRPEEYTVELTRENCGIYIYIQNNYHNEKQFEINLIPVKFDTYSLSVLDFFDYKDRDNVVTAINVSKNKSSAQIASEIDRRLYDTFKKAVEYWQIKKAAHDTREAQKTKVKKLYEANNFRFYQDDKATFKDQDRRIDITFNYAFTSAEIKISDLDVETPLPLELIKLACSLNTYKDE